MVIILSPWPLLCFSTSMCAPVAPLMALMLLPPLPMTRDIAFKGTDTFFTPDSVVETACTEDFLTTSFQPSSRFPGCFGLVDDVLAAEGVMTSVS